MALLGLREARNGKGFRMDCVDSVFAAGVRRRFDSWDRGVSHRREKLHSIPKGDITMSMALKVGGVILICVGIHFGLSATLPLIVFGAGLAMIVLS
jgi:hypothetical protein